MSLNIKGQSMSITNICKQSDGHGSQLSKFSKWSKYEMSVIISYLKWNEWIFCPQIPFLISKVRKLIQ